MFARRRPLLTLGGLLLLAVLVGAAVVAASDRGVSKQQGPLTQATEHLSLGKGRIIPADTVLTDSDLATDESPIWAVHPGPSGLQLTIFPRGSPSTYSVVTHTLKVTTTRTTQYAMSRDAGTERLYLIDRTGNTVTVRSVDPRSAAAPAIVGRVTVFRPQFGSVRSFFMAHWSGVSPDLFVVDRGSTLARMSLSIYSGDSHLQSRVVSTISPIRGLSPRNWVVRLARIDAKPDLVLIALRPPSAHAEVHVLSGESGFQAFTIQKETAIPSEKTSGDVLVTGNSLGSPSLFVINTAHGDRVDVYPLLTVPPNLG